MKRLISVGVLMMIVCASFAQIKEFLNPPQEAYPKDVCLSEESLNPLWCNTAGKAVAAYVARDEVMKKGVLELDISALALSDSLLCVHRKSGERDIYHVVNPTGEYQKVVVYKDAHRRNANIYNPRTGTISGMIPSPDSRGVYREVVMNPKEDLYVVFEKYRAPKMKVYDSESVFAMIDARPKVASSSGCIDYSARFDITEKRLRKERNVGNRFVIDLGNLKAAADAGEAGVAREVVISNPAVIVRVNGGESADTLWCAPYIADITDRLIPGSNQLQITVINPHEEAQTGLAPMLQNPIRLKLLRHKQILETRP